MNGHNHGEERKEAEGLEGSLEENVGVPRDIILIFVGRAFEDFTRNTLEFGGAKARVKYPMAVRSQTYPHAISSTWTLQFQRSPKDTIGITVTSLNTKI